jgi:hypothetical protein
MLAAEGWTSGTIELPKLFEFVFECEMNSLLYVNAIF